MSKSRFSLSNPFKPSKFRPIFANSFVFVGVPPEIKLEPNAGLAPTARFSADEL